MRVLAPAFLALLSSTTPACLGPLVDDDLDPSGVFPAADAPVTHVEDDPTLAERVAAFPAAIARLRGYADGEPVWYWNVPGPVDRLIAPVYAIVGPDGERVGAPIFDVIPGAPGYTPWWRATVVRTTERYEGEQIRSREAIDLGVRLGILERPEAQTTVLNCPIVRRDVEVDLGMGATATTSRAWYRGQVVHYVPFSDGVELPVSERQMPVYPVYVLQRIDEPAPLYERLTGVDLNGDGVLDASNNIFAGGLDAERYSPLWFLALVRTTSDYASIDSAGPVGIMAESDFTDETLSPGSPDVLSIEPQPETYVNCPIQREAGKL